MDLFQLADELDAKPEELPKLQYRMADSFHTAPGWREIGMHYSCVPDSVYPWDPQVMKEIWKFAPDATPLWVQWVFLSPSDTGNPKVEVFGRHALGRRVVNPSHELEPFRVLMPTMPCQGLTFEKPNKIWFIHDGAPSKVASDLPGNYLGFDHSMLERARDEAVGFTMTEKEFREFMVNRYIEQKRVAKAKRMASIADDMEYRARDLRAYAQKQLDNVSDVERAEFLRSAGKRERTTRPMVF